MQRISQLVLRPDQLVPSPHPGQTQLTPIQQELRLSLTASQLVSDWSGTMAQINVQQDLKVVAGVKNIPSLADVTKAFNNKTAVYIVSNHLQSLCNFGDTVVKEDQFIDTALLIVTEYYYLNLSELCLFFRRCKIGVYGQLVWGSRLNIQQVMSALYQFSKDRVEAINKRETEEFNTAPKVPMASRMVFIQQGLSGLKDLKKKALTDYNAFRELFPKLPEDKLPEEYWEAWKIDEKNVGMRLCEFNMK